MCRFCAARNSSANRMYVECHIPGGLGGRVEKGQVIPTQAMLELPNTPDGQIDFRFARRFLVQAVAPADTGSDD